MRKSNREVNGEKVFRYSIRKYHFGAASVAVAALMFFANGAVKADSSPVPHATTANTEKVNAGVEGVPPEKSLEAEGNKGTVAPESEKKTSNKEDGAQSNPTPAKEGKIEPKKPEATVNKAKLETLIKEVEGLNLEKYTEESVKGLKTELAKAKEVFETAQNKEEVEAAWRTLFTYKNSKLVVKKTPKLPQDNTPKPDTTNGKETAGINAENTEPNGTNIAGHNHSMNGTTRSEGSGFRAVPAGDAYFNLDSGTLETEVGSAPNAKFLVVWRKRQGYKPQLTSDGLGIRLEYDRQIPDNDFVKRLFNTTGSVNIVGSYDVAFEMKDGSSGVVYEKKSFKVVVKPLAPRVTVENLENAAGTRAKVTATARNPQYSSGEQPGESSVDFYVNGVKKQTVTAVNGVAEWIPTEVFNVNDRITATNTARDKQFLPSRGTNINVPITATTSNMSSEVVIPAPTTPTLNKDGAKNEVNTAFTNKSNQVNGDASFTNEEKAEIIELAKTAKDEAIRNIDAAQDETTLNNAKSTGVTNIGNVTLPRTAKKAEAIAEIDAAKVAKDAAIEGNANITDKAAAKAATKAAADAAKAEINKDTTNTAALVTTEKEKGLLGLEKAGAIAEIDAALAAKNKKVDINNDLTTEEKAEVKKQTQKEATDAIANTNEATTSTTVTTAKDNGIKAINAVALPTKTVKSDAISEINKALAAKNKTVDTNNNLTTEEKSEVKKQTQKEATDAIANINKATTSADVTTVKDNGIKAINAVAIPTKTVKSNAIEEVKKALDTKIKSIESSNEFTDNDKGILKDKAEKAAMTAIVKIKTATTNAAVETAKTEGIERINSIEANLPATLDFPEFTGGVNGEIVEPTETLKEELIITKWQYEKGNELKPAENREEQGGENKPQPASVVPSDDTTREPEVVTSNSQPVSSENNVPKQNDSKSHAALPNTGSKEDRAAGALGILSLLGAFGLLFAKKKKDDEEEA